MSDLRIAVLGVGMMGADHVARISSRISGARVTVVNDYLVEKAEQIAASVPGCRAIGDPLDAIADSDVDAVVLATPGPTHEKQLLACLEHGKPVMCEKPLTTEVATSLEVVKREAEVGKKLIQVGFMRRFDHEYEQLKLLIDGGELQSRCGGRQATQCTSAGSVQTRWFTRSTSPDSCSVRRSPRFRSSGPQRIPVRRKAFRIRKSLSSRRRQASTSMSRSSSPPVWPMRCAPSWSVRRAAR